MSIFSILIIVIQVKYYFRYTDDSFEVKRKHLKGEARAKMPFV